MALNPIVFSERREEIVSDASVPDPEDVPAARARRDAGWTLVRAAWVTSDVDAARVKSWAGDRPLEDAFEGSIHEADDHDDARFGHATQLANLAQIDAELAELVEKRRAVEDEKLGIDEVASRLDDEWRALWEPVGVCPETVDAGEEWLPSTICSAALRSFAGAGSTLTRSPPRWRRIVLRSWTP